MAGWSGRCVFAANLVSDRRPGSMNPGPQPRAHPGHNPNPRPGHPAKPFVRQATYLSAGIIGGGPVPT